MVVAALGGALLVDAHCGSERPPDNRASDDEGPHGTQEVGPTSVLRRGAIWLLRSGPAVPIVPRSGDATNPQQSGKLGEFCAREAVA